MKLIVTTVALLLVSTLAACSSPAGTTTSTRATSGADTAAEPATGTGTGTSASTGAGATCDDACTHYLQCKGTDDADNRALCGQQCAAMGATSTDLANFVAADCASAVAAIDGSPASAPQPGGAAPGGSGSSDCNGCVWDGGSCIYLTGSGGNYFACDAACCGH